MMFLGELIRSDCGPVLDSEKLRTLPAHLEWNNDNLIKHGHANTAMLECLHKPDSIMVIMCKRSYCQLGWGQDSYPKMVHDACDLQQNIDYVRSDVMEDDGSINTYHIYSFNALKKICKNSSLSNYEATFNQWKTNHFHQRNYRLRILEALKNKQANTNDYKSIENIPVAVPIVQETKKQSSSAKSMIVVRTEDRAKFIVSADIQSKLEDLIDSLDEFTISYYDNEVVDDDASVIVIENISKENVLVAMRMYK